MNRRIGIVGSRVHDPFIKPPPAPAPAPAPAPTENRDGEKEREERGVWLSLLFVHS